MSVTQKISHKGLAELAGLAYRQGWTVAFTNGSHLRWRSPDGKTTVVTGSTPSESGFKQDKHKLRRSGLLTTLDEVKRLERAQRPTAAQDEEPEVPTTFMCRHTGCSAGAFGTMNRRDSHEQYECEYRPGGPKHETPTLTADVPDQSAPSPAGSEPTPEPTQAPRYKKPRKMRTKKCRFCDRRIAVNAFERHVQAKHAGEAPPARTRTPRSPAQQVATGDVKLVDRLVGVVFPDGVPLEPGKLSALAGWLEDTEKFLMKVELS